MIDVIVTGQVMIVVNDSRDGCDHIGNSFDDGDFVVKLTIVISIMVAGIVCE